MSRVPGRIVVGVSGSLANLAALRVALDQARSTGARLIAVHAWSPVGGEFAYLRAPCPQLLEVWQEMAHDCLRSALENCCGAAPSDVTLEPRIIRAEPGPALVRVAGGPTDLLVIGTGRQGPTRRFRPGVTGYCLRHAVCPVLSVPQPELIRSLRDARRWQSYDRVLHIARRSGS
jgi:nucleotide-binding universal stress UspA family protein